VVLCGFAAGFFVPVCFGCFLETALLFAVLDFADLAEILARE